MVAIRHLDPLSTDEDLLTGVFLCGRSGHSKLPLGLSCFQALHTRGILAFERVGVS